MQKPSRKSSKYENTEFRAMLGRMIRSYGERVALGDEIDLAEMIELRGVLEDAITAAVLGQRKMYGRSWAWVAAGLGVTRQAAYQRYGKGVRPPTRP